MNINWVGVFLAFHIAAMVFWLGPSLGAWMVLRAGEKRMLINNDIAWVWRSFLKLMWWEHGAFIALLISGVGLISTIGYPLSTPWLKWKLILVAGILVPIEIIDSYFAHYRLPKIYEKNHGLVKNEMASIRRYHAFTRLMIPLFLILIPLIFYFAIFKPII